MNYLYDTNLLIYIIKQHAAVTKLENEIDAYGGTNLRIISIVSKGEIKSLALQLELG